jgi:hypothetical protein
MDTTHKPCDVFISRKSADATLAKKIYHFLKNTGLEVFESDETLPKLGSSDYRKAIDKALDECKHMIVVGSAVENISSSWVEAEWGFYIGEKRAGRKEGNILTVITNKIKIEELPASLRYYEVIYFSKENFEKIGAYTGKNYSDPVYEPKPKSIFKSKWFLPIVAFIFFIVALVYFIKERSKPFDATVILKPDNALKLNPAYPPFEGGTLSFLIDDKLEEKKILPNQELVFKQIPASYSNNRIYAKLTSKYWKLIVDTLVLSRTMNIKIVPDESLSKVFGRVVSDRNDLVDNCRVLVDDTATIADVNGNFSINLPIYRQKMRYKLIAKKNNYSYEADYNAGTGSIDLGPLKKN